MRKQKIAVIGSGVGAMTAVYAITQTENWNAKFDITVYQLGWRSGGKGASGRNKEFGQRIEEHGLHVWAGFYDNAFRNMRDCYDELVERGLRKPTDPLGTLDQAFKPLSHLFLAENVNDQWRPWVIDLPQNDIRVGSRTRVPTPFEMFLNTLKIAAKFISSGEMQEPNSIGLKLPNGLHEHHNKIINHTETLSGNPHKHSANQLNILADLIQDAQDWLHNAQTPKHLADDPMRRGLYLMDLALAFAYGMVTTRTFTKGYDALDVYEFSDYLKMNGASKGAIDWVAVRGCYDFVFGFNQGNVNQRGDVGAGTAIRAMSRLLFTYSTAIFHKMQAGMGDTIFAPYYQVLKSKGVKFKYLNAATNLVLDTTGTKIETIDMVEQAKAKSGEYNPLVDVKGLPCWPSEPDWSQLENGESLKASGIDFESEKSIPSGKKYSLTRGKDFNDVILGASIGSLKYLTKELSAKSPQWNDMLKHVKTVGTHAAQFWTTKNADDLGWRNLVEQHNASKTIPASPMRTIITGFSEPLDTWADMSHLLDREDWPNDGPKSIAYFCAPALDGETLPKFDKAVKDWTNKELTKLWPDASLNGKFDQSLFYPKKLSSQYSRVNMYGSERYVLSTTNSVYYRLKPGGSGFENLYLAGDWTLCGLNAGCVEAATISGIAAAAAITNEKILNVGATDLDEGQSALEQSIIQSPVVSAAKWPLTGFYARGEMSGWFAFYAMPKSEVARLLPDGMYLGDDPLAPTGYHTVGTSFCRFQNVRGSFAPAFTAMSPYGEATFAIPYTQTAQGGGAQFYYPRCLYVNNKLAIFDGKFFYAMPKNYADVMLEDHEFSATTVDGLILKSSFIHRGKISPLIDHKSIANITSILGKNFVTQNKRGKQYFNAFNLNLDRCFIAPGVANIEVTDPNPDGFPMINQTVVPLQNSAVKEIPGAFKIWSNWSLTNPFDSKRILKASMANHFANEVNRGFN